MNIKIIARIFLLFLFILDENDGKNNSNGITIQELTTVYGEVLLINKSSNGSTTVLDESDAGDKPLITAEQLKHIAIVFGCFGIVGNLLVIIALYDKNLKIHEILIINQSFIDVLCSTAMVIFFHWVIGHDMSYSGLSPILKNFYCFIFDSTAIFWGLFDASTYNLCLVTIERYIAITLPFYHHVNVTKFKIKISIIITAILGMSIQIIPGVLVNKMQENKCKIWQVWYIPNGSKILGIFLFVFEWLTPMTVLVLCNAHMAWKIHTSRKDSKDAKRNAARNNLFITMLLVALGFLLCNSWNALYFFTNNIGRPIFTKSTSVYRMTVLIYLANAMINPFVYTLQYQHFRDRIMLLFGCRKPQHQRSEENTTKMSFQGTDYTKNNAV